MKNQSIHYINCNLDYTYLYIYNTRIIVRVVEANFYL